MMFKGCLSSPFTAILTDTFCQGRPQLQFRSLALQAVVLELPLEYSLLVNSLESMVTTVCSTVK